MQPRTVGEILRCRLPGRIGVNDWHVWKVQEFAVHIDSVDAETVTTLVEPEVHSFVIKGLTDDWVLPVEVRLLGSEQVQVILCRRSGQLEIIGLSQSWGSPPRLSRPTPIRFHRSCLANCKAGDGHRQCNEQVARCTNRASDPFLTNGIP